MKQRIFEKTSYRLDRVGRNGHHRPYDCRPEILMKMRKMTRTIRTRRTKKSRRSCASRTKTRLASN